MLSLLIQEALLDDNLINFHYNTEAISLNLYNLA